MNVIYFPDVNVFLLSLDQETRGQTAKLIRRLKDQGLKLRPPDSKKIGEDLYELRTRGKNKARVFYTIKDSNIYLLNAFIKRSWGLPKQEIDKARARIRVLAEYSR